MEYKVSLYLTTNGTMRVFEEENSILNASTCIIFICFLLGVAYNFLLSAAILNCKQFRSSNFYLIIFQLSVICFLDCLLNGSVAFGYSFAKKDEWCFTSAIVFQFFLFMHSVIVCVLCGERTLYLQGLACSVQTFIYVFFGMWIIGLLFVTPVLSFGSVFFFPGRNACCPVISNVWLQLEQLLGYLLCWIVVLVSFVFCFRVARENVKKNKELSVLSILPITNSGPETLIPPLTTFTPVNKVVLSVLLLYMVLILPHTLSVIVSSFTHPEFYPNPWSDPRHPTDILSVEVNEIEYLFIYFRYMYNIVVPILVLTSDRDLRKSSRNLFLCKKNAITNSSLSPMGVSDFTKTDANILPVNNMKIPVLFATSGGLYLRYPSQTNYLNMSNLASVSSSNNGFRLMSIFCDSNTKPNAEPSLYYLKRHKFENSDGIEDVERRNVRFSSKIDAISPVLNSGEMSQFSQTQVVQNPIFVKADVNNPQHVGSTYSKM